VTEKKPNLPASVAARLLNRANDEHVDYQTLLTNYCFERFLYRLGKSSVKDRFLLKGAMLLRAWTDQPYRATRDLDLLRRGDESFEAIRSDLRIICATKVEPDGVEFDATAIRVAAIRAEGEYAGARAHLAARCHSARLELQIDMGSGDSVWPAPRSIEYPTLLEFPNPKILAYPREAVVAEKLEAMVVLGDRNSRIKDFFDVHYLAKTFEFDRLKLTEAIRRTFARRRTPIPSEAPIALTPRYWENPSRPIQVRAFARRAGLKLPDPFSREIATSLESFLMPIIEDLRVGKHREGVWRSGGPWR
jgi:hypothetical protein